MRLQNTTLARSGSTLISSSKHQFTQFLRNKITYLAILFCVLPLAMWSQVGKKVSTPSDSVRTVAQPGITSFSDTSRLDSLDAPLSDSLSGPVAANPANQQKIIDSLKANSDLVTKVDYSASDSIVFEVDSNMLYLYSESKISYEETILEAAEVQIDWGSQTMYANGIEDSTGELTGTPTFQEGEGNYEAERMAYNFKSEKGRIIGGAYPGRRRLFAWKDCKTHARWDL